MVREMKLEIYEKEHIEMLQKLAPECMVLLKSDGSFPIEKPCKVALFGSGARRTIKGGTGSGDVNVRHFVTVEEGLEKAGFTITTKEWLDNYDAIYVEARKSFVDSIKNQAKEKGIPAVLLGLGAVMPEPEYELPLEETGELAIYVLSRISGEGSDRKAVKGDFYLTETEIRDIHALQEKYEKFLLVLNVGGVIDMSPLADIENVLLLSQLGMTVGDSFADVLLGKTYPSGKLTTTWATEKDYCKVGTFGEEDDTRYNEGIYVGYRYFDTVNKTPIFPFGYGLQYTEFKLSDWETKLEGERVFVSAKVENTGAFLGKEVVQVYVTLPSGKLDQPYQVLAAFAKTKELKAGETELVETSFSFRQLASFDETSAQRILEAGDYILRIGNSSRNTHVCGVIRVEEEIIVEELSHVGGRPDFEDWKPIATPWTYEEEKEYAEAPVYSYQACSEMATKAAPLMVKDEDRQLLASMSDSDLAYLCVGRYEEVGSQSVIGAAGITVAGAAGETCNHFTEKGIPSLVMADGPAGLRLHKEYGVDENGIYTVGENIPAAMIEFVDEALLKVLGKSNEKKSERHGKIHYQYCSAIPIGTALAQSWNVELCQKCGDIVGAEMERFGVHLWLAPALNIHRSVLCGRNFEYYSEDPLVSGKIAAAVTRGVEKHPGCGVTIKHFVANNQETNRFHSNSILSERALRDIYLKGFEIVVKEAKPAAIMTSYNLLNGEHTSERRDLNHTVLREEWGYEGLVMSDWLTQGFASGRQFKYPYACASGSIKAGNDLMMPGGKLDYEDLMEALHNPEHKYHITRENLEECAFHVIRTARRLGKIGE